MSNPWPAGKSANPNGRPGKKGQFSEVSKGVIQNDICEFESSQELSPNLGDGKGQAAAA
jgi:hypothetical protein